MREIREDKGDIHWKMRDEGDERANRAAGPSCATRTLLMISSFLILRCFF